MFAEIRKVGIIKPCIYVYASIDSRYCFMVFVYQKEPQAARIDWEKFLLSVDLRAGHDQLDQVVVFTC